RNSWIYIDGENFQAARVDIGGDPKNEDVHIAWKYTYNGKDTWLGPTQNLGSIGSLYCLTMDPYEQYDMVFNGAVASRPPTSSPGQYAGEDNGWVLALVYPVILELDQSIVKYPSIKRYPGGASNDIVPDLQHPENPIPMIDPTKPINIKGGGD